MRKGTKLLLLAAVALSGAACLSALGCGPAMAAPLEPTDSGAPSAIVIFPVGEKPNPKAAAMPPVAFNHVVHEKWMSRANKDCMVCHHTGDPIACTTCHTIEGSPEGGNITLERAMHAVKIAPRKDGTPSSCVSCHENTMKQRNCAGCHGQLVRNARESDKWCVVCHSITPRMTAQQLQAGIQGKLPDGVNEQLAAETAAARPHTKYWSPMVAPYKVEISALSGKYEPCVFNHRHHVADLMARVKNSELAQAFHNDPATMCVTCHHHSPASTTPPKCSSCHSIGIDKEHPGRPSLMAAYHLQCMNCHKDMNVARPRNTDCTTCHKLRPVQGASK